MDTTERVPADISAPAAPASGTPAQLQSAWPSVHVDAMEVDETGASSSGRLVVRACVSLGPLLPVDVEVELLGAVGEGRTGQIRMLGARLWPAHSYHNDSYGFETSVAAESCRGLRCLGVRVTPRAGAAETGALRPVEHWTPLTPGFGQPTPRRSASSPPRV